MDFSKAQITKLVKGCMGNERQAQETLYRAYYAEMFRICARYSRSTDSAQEALNEGFLKVFKNIGTFDEKKGGLGGWISTVIIRTAIDYNRKELRFVTENYPEQDLANEHFVSPEVLNKLYAEDLLKNIRLLPAATRIIFNLSVIDGYTHREISEQLQITESTSRWHLTEAKKKLRVLLQAGNTSKPTDNTGEK